MRLSTQNVQHLLCPSDGNLFVQNAFLEDHVLDACFAREGAAMQEIPLFDGPVVRQLFLVLFNLAPDFGAQIDFTQCGIGAQLDHEFVP